MNAPTSEEAAEVLREVFAEAERQCAGVDGPDDCERCEARSVVLTMAVAAIVGATWQPIDSAPKSTVDGSRVGGIYLLGFIPDADVMDDQAKVDVIWWEPLMPNSAGGRGKWCASSFGDSVEVAPSHWRSLPAAPGDSAFVRGEG